MKLNYLVDIQNIVLSCINSNATVQAYFFDDNLDPLRPFKQFNDCESIYGHSILNSKKIPLFSMLNLMFFVKIIKDVLSL